MNILFLNAGRRVELVRLFRAAGHELGVNPRVIGTDVQPFAPALRECEACFRLPDTRSAEFPVNLLGLCQRESIDLIVPTIDPDLRVLAQMRDELASCGVLALVGPSASIDICRDKVNLATFLGKRGFPAVPILSADEACCPAFVKPRDGSASIHAFPARTPEELSFFSRYVPNAIIQPLLTGAEYTVDVFCDRDLRAIATIPRRRLKVRSGEVVLARVERDEALEKLAASVAEALQLIGPSNLQIIRGASGPQIIEVNPRFGGGCPLSIAAGAPLARWALQLVLGDTLDASFTVRDGYTMMRYDQSFFTDHGDKIFA